MTGKSHWFRFLRQEVLPRGTAVIFHRNVNSALALSLLSCTGVWFIPDSGSFPVTKFSELATATLAFAGLSFGGAIGAVLMAIGLPTGPMFDTMVVNSTASDRRFVVGESGPVDQEGNKMTKTHFDKSFRSLYLDLIFVFQMAAVAQLMLAVTSVLVLVFVGASAIRPETPAWTPAIALAAMTFFTSYAVLQLASSLRALNGLARNRDLYHRRSLLGR